MRKKISGCKRHALVDTNGRGLVREPHSTSIQNRDGAGPLLQASRRSIPLIEGILADSQFASERVAKATVIAIEISRKNPDQIGFAVQPRRWIVERLVGWAGRNRIGGQGSPIAKDFEVAIASARGILYAASIMLLVRRTGRTSWLSKSALSDGGDKRSTLLPGTGIIADIHLGLWFGVLAGGKHKFPNPTPYETPSCQVQPATTLQPARARDC